MPLDKIILLGVVAGVLLFSGLYILNDKPINAGDTTTTTLSKLSETATTLIRMSTTTTSGSSIPSVTTTYGDTITPVSATTTLTENQIKFNCYKSDFNLNCNWAGCEIGKESVGVIYIEDTNYLHTINPENSSTYAFENLNLEIGKFYNVYLVCDNSKVPEIIQVMWTI